MLGDWLIGYFQREAGVLRRAPFLSAVLVATGIAGGWWLASMHYAERMQVYEQRLIFSDQQLESLRQSSPATPSASVEIVAPPQMSAKAQKISDALSAGGWSVQLGGAGKSGWAEHIWLSTANDADGNALRSAFDAAGIPYWWEQAPAGAVPKISLGDRE